MQWLGDWMVVSGPSLGDGVTSVSSVVGAAPVMVLGGSWGEFGCDCC